MIVGSLVVILTAAGLLLSGLLLSSDWLLAGSIFASVLAAALLYLVARQRAAEHSEGPNAMVDAAVGAGQPLSGSPTHPASEEVWLGGSADEDDPADEPAIERRPARRAALVAQLDAEVLVIDGRPRYHLAGCAHLAGQTREPLPVGEATELGFTPCALCQPDSVIASHATAASS